MVDYYIGTMGFSYRDWAGPFYPRGLSASDYLSYYGRMFNAVEIDSTFYGTPRRDALIRWRDTTPQGFKICVKVPRVITHDSRLVDCFGEMKAFIGSMRELGDKLGVIIFQFPPSYDSKQFEIVNDFLSEMPTDICFAVEFRHSSWYTAQTASMLTSHNVCWVATEFESVPKEVVLTSDLILIRFIGKHGQFRLHDREQIDVTPKLDWWWRWIQAKVDSVAAVYGFFNDDFSGHAPAAANKLKQIIGLPIVKSDLPKQMRLF
jgi:uncharacterized protein YecE (DUF72 family)